MRPFALLPPGTIVIVGSDIPAITPAQVMAAFRALGQNDFVLGPATDGANARSTSLSLKTTLVRGFVLAYG